MEGRKEKGEYIHAHWEITQVPCYLPVAENLLFRLALEVSSRGGFEDQIQATFAFRHCRLAVCDLHVAAWGRTWDVERKGSEKNKKYPTAPGSDPGIYE